MRAIQCIDVVLKTAFLGDNGVQCGRSFFMCPTRRIDLGDFYELYTGLFQSTVLGMIPYVNVDVAHKAFPMAMRMMDIIKQIAESNSRGGAADLSRQLDNFSLTKLRTHLKGLRIAYEMPNDPASKKVYKFADLAQPASKLVFKCEGKDMTVQQYFLTRKYKIIFPEMPCIKVGNAIKNICLPAELCSIQGGQVSRLPC